MVVSSLRTPALKTTFNCNNKPTSGSAPPPSPSAAAPSTTTISSLSTASLPLTTLLPTALQQTVHVSTWGGESPFELHVRSRAASVDNTPTYHGGDVITGNVVLNVTPKEAQYVASVEIELQGEIGVKGKTPYRFLSKRSTLWTSTPSANNTTTPVSSQTNRVDARDIRNPHKTQIPSASLDQHCRSPYDFFCSTLQSMGRSNGREREVEEPSHAVISTQSNKPRIRLEPSRAHVWPFELSVPTCISSSATTSPRGPDCRFAAPLCLILHPSKLGGDDVEASEGEGGVRSEKTGYGVGWDVGDGSRRSQHAGNATHQKQKKDLTEKTIPNETLHRILFEDQEKLSRHDSRPTVLTLGSEQHAYRLPPSFSESACVAYLEYKLAVTVHRRGALRVDKSLQAKLHIPDLPYTEPRNGLSLRGAHPGVVASRLPAPSECPDAWNLTPEVVMQLQPAIRRPGGPVSNGISKEIVFKLALSRPLCYARGTTIPFRITISIPHPHVSASQNKQVSSVRKYRMSSTLASHASAMSVPSVALGVTPLFRKCHSMSPLTSGGMLSHVETQARPSPVTGQESQAQSSELLVPSGEAIASSIRLVRAIHVGPDANDNGKLNRDCTSYEHTISTATILDDESAGQGVADDPEETGCDIKGWTTEHGRLVRTFAGEILLKGDIRPSFVFSHFVLQYAVVLFPFDVSGFMPLSNEPLWSEPVTIAAQPAESGSVPSLVSEDQPVIDKVDREIYTRYFASSNQ